MRAAPWRRGEQSAGPLSPAPLPRAPRGALRAPPVAASAMFVHAVAVPLLREHPRVRSKHTSTMLRFPRCVVARKEDKMPRYRYL